MAITISYTYSTFFEDCKKISETESLTIPQLDSAKGYITQEATPFLGVIEERDRESIYEHLVEAAANLYYELRPWLDVKKGMKIVDLTGGTDKQIVYTLKEGILPPYIEDEVEQQNSNAPILAKHITDALRSYALAWWFSKYPHRGDLTQKFTMRYASIPSLIASLLHEKVTRPYRFY